MGFGNTDSVNILDKRSFSALSLATCSSYHSVFPFRDWWGLLGQLNQLPPQLGGLFLKLFPQTRQLLSRLAPAACLLGGMQVLPGHLILSDPISTVPPEGPMKNPRCWEGPRQHTLIDNYLTPYLVSSNDKHLPLFLTLIG